MGSLVQMHLEPHRAIPIVIDSQYYFIYFRFRSGFCEFAAGAGSPGAGSAGAGSAGAGSAGAGSAGAGSAGAGSAAAGSTGAGRAAAWENFFIL